MEDIKFRAWHFATRGMSYWSAEKQDFDLAAALQNKGAYAVMRSTGLKDSCGQEIYEGDVVVGVMREPSIVGDPDPNAVPLTGAVYFDFGFELRVLKHLSHEWHTFSFPFVMDDGRLFMERSVLGNIYEDPDLLKN